MTPSLRSKLSSAVYRLTSLDNRVHHTLLSFARPDAQVDPAVRYPSYKPMDEFIDVERLVALDGVVTAQVEECLKEGVGETFDTGFLKMKPLARRAPGSKVIALTASEREFQYHDLRFPEIWKPTPEVERFPELMEFIATLPFKAVGRAIIMCDDGGRKVTAHRDHWAYDILHEFIWFRTNLNKPFYMQDWQSREKQYIESHSAWFDTVNQYHGADAIEGPSISIRVDGRFTDELRALIPRPVLNPASTPSYWACVSG